MRIKLNILLAVFIYLAHLTTIAQSTATKKVVKSLLSDAKFSFDSEDYPTAWQIYRQVLSIDQHNDEASVNGALCAIKLRFVLDSTVDLISNLSHSNLTEAKYCLARIKQKQKHFDQSILLFNEYNLIDQKKRIFKTEETDYLIKNCKDAQQLISQPHRAAIKNMGSNINSQYADYVPVIVPDESALYFTSKRPGSPNSKVNGDDNYYEDVYVSFNYKGTWERAQNAGKPINSETNDGCVAISPDGHKMIVYRTASDMVSGDLYITRAGKDNKWQPLELMSKEINSHYVESSACFSNDTSEIYFSSNRPGGYGGKDIYRIKKLPNGKWSTAYNLGPQVNTKYDEDAPFLHPDGVTLFFSSRGHNTMGEYDVFKSVLNEETHLFSKAENLGYPINDVGDDIFFVLSVDGKRGYYSSIKSDSYGDVDIYQVDTRYGDNDLKVKLGLAFLDDSPGRVKITLIDKETNEETGHFYSHPVTGKFILVMNPLKSYKAIVEEEGFDTVERDLTPIVMEKSDIELEFKLKKG